MRVMPEIMVCILVFMWSFRSRIPGLLSKLPIFVARAGHEMDPTCASGKEAREPWGSEATYNLLWIVKALRDPTKYIP